MTARPLTIAAVLLAPLAPGVARAADVTLTTGDGVKLAARYFPGNLGAKSPAVLIIDDLDEARPTATDELARQLAKDGCSVLCFDFRGCGRSRTVEPEFWDSATNQQSVKGYKADALPEEIRFSDFKPSYLPVLVNDVAAARAHLEKRNDAHECNTGQLYVIGLGRGAALGQLWVASEWARYRVSGTQNKVASKPEGRNVAGFVWVGPRFALDRQTVPMFDLLKQSLAKKTALAGLVYDSDDSDASRFAKQCQEAFNPKGRAPLVATHATTRDSAGPRTEAAEQVGKMVAGMRKVQEQPLWENRNFGDRRYVWAFRGAPLIAAKDEGDDFFQSLPVDHLLGKR